MRRQRKMMLTQEHFWSGMSPSRLRRTAPTSRWLLRTASSLFLFIYFMGLSISVCAHLVKTTLPKVFLSQYNIPVNHGSGVYDDNPSSLGVPKGKCPVFGKKVVPNAAYNSIYTCQEQCGIYAPITSITDPYKCSQEPLSVDSVSSFIWDRSTNTCYKYPGVQIYTGPTLLNQKVRVEKSQATVNLVWGSDHIRSDWETKCPKWILQDTHMGVLGADNTCTKLPVTERIIVKDKLDCGVQVFTKSTTMSDAQGIHFANYYPNNECELSTTVPTCFLESPGGYSLTSLGSIDFAKDVVKLECYDLDPTPKPSPKNPICEFPNGEKCGEGVKKLYSCVDFQLHITTEKCTRQCECSGTERVVENCLVTGSSACGSGNKLIKECEHGLWRESKEPCSISCDCVESTSYTSPCEFEYQLSCGNGVQSVNKCKSGTWMHSHVQSCVKDCTCLDGEVKPYQVCKIDPSAKTCGEGKKTDLVCETARYSPVEGICSKTFQLVGECKYTTSDCGPGKHTVEYCKDGTLTQSEEPCYKECTGSGACNTKIEPKFSECKDNGKTKCIGEETTDLCPNGLNVKYTQPCELPCNDNSLDVADNRNAESTSNTSTSTTSTSTTSTSTTSNIDNTTTQFEPEENQNVSFAVGVGVATGLLLLAGGGAGYALYKKRGISGGKSLADPSEDFGEKTMEEEERETLVNVDANASFWEGAEAGEGEAKVASDTDAVFWGGPRG